MTSGEEWLRRAMLVGSEPSWRPGLKMLATVETDALTVVLDLPCESDNLELDLVLLRGVEVVNNDDCTFSIPSLRSVLRVFGSDWAGNMHATAVV